LDDALVDFAEIAFGAATLDADVGRAALRVLEDLKAPDCLVLRFAELDLGCLVAIWLSSNVNDSVMCCHWHKPRDRARREEIWRLCSRRRLAYTIEADFNGSIDDRAIHPHPYGDSDAPDSAEVQRIWSNLVAHIAPLR
jgi:hypothetical protein